MNENLRRHSGVLLWLGLAVLVAVPALAATADDEFPDDPARALQHYENEQDDWSEGPVMWLMLEDEADLWDELETETEKREFIAWFWDRRDPDLRDDVNTFQQGFYERVAAANSRYQGFPRGWKSDQGRLHVVLGQPDAVSPATPANPEQLVWTYYTVGPQGSDAEFEGHTGEMTVIFVREAGEIGYTLYDEFGGVGAMPTYLSDALEFTKEAYVVNPDLQMSRTMTDGS